mgnify:CR=1 FL=1
MSIRFFEEDRKIPYFFRKKPVYECIKKILSIESKKKLEFIHIIFCSDEYVLEINKKYLQHDYYTDIITFDYSTTHIESDMYISFDRIVENTKHNSVLLLSEIHRVIIHGVLHLVGYNDSTPELKKIMTETENYYLDLI